jgi:hypothetical protein
MSKVSELKEALLDELLSQVKEGTRVLTKDGDLETVSPPASVLGVAAKVVKDFADELKDNDELVGKAQSLANYLEKRRANVVTPPN